MPGRHLDCTNAVEVFQLQERIERDLAGRIEGFHVLIGTAGLILRGNVQTYYLKQLVQHAVMEATSEPIMANEIDVF